MKDLFFLFIWPDFMPEFFLAVASIIQMIRRVVTLNVNLVVFSEYSVVVISTSQINDLLFRQSSRVLLNIVVSSVPLVVVSATVQLVILVHHDHVGVSLF